MSRSSRTGRPHWPGPPLHHHDFDEAFYVLEGELTFQVGDEIVTGGRGELAFAPRNVVHTLANHGDAPARYVLVITPAGFERYFARMADDPPEWALQPFPETTVVGPQIASPAMKRAIFIAPFDELSEPARVVELAQRAERRGWDGFFLWDHIDYRPPVCALADPWILMAAIAAAHRAGDHRPAGHAARAPAPASAGARDRHARPAQRRPAGARRRRGRTAAASSTRRASARRAT